MIHTNKMQGLWAGLLVAAVSLLIPILSTSTALAADSYTWMSSTSIKDATTNQTYSVPSSSSCAGAVAIDGGATCTAIVFAHSGTLPSCTLSTIPDGYSSPSSSWPSGANSVIEVPTTDGSTVDTKSTSIKLFTPTGPQGGTGGNTCKVTVSTISVTNTSNSASADYAYTDPSTIRKITTGFTFKQSPVDAKRFAQVYGTSTVNCPDYIELGTVGGTTGILHVATDINGATCEYDNRTNSDGEIGPTNVTISKTAPSGIPTDPHASDTTSGGTADDCPLAATAPLRWLGCPLIAIGADAVQALQNQIQNLLYTPVSQIFDNAGFKATSNAFRNIGVGLIVIAGLAMVISQASGMDFVDAYTVRKLLPRLAIALIGMVLAWPLLRFIVTFFNDLGLWASSIVGSLPKVSTTASDAGGLGGVLSAVFVVAGGWAAISLMGFGAIISLLGTVLLGLLVGFLVLAVRQIVVFVTILIAPLAIAAYVLPGTQKLWKFWHETFFTTLFMFPIIMMFLASGKALSTVLSATGNPGMTLMAVFVYFAPFFLLPFAFKLAGGLMSTVFSIANDRNKGAFDRLRKSRQASGAAHRERTIGRRVLQERSNLNNMFQKQASSGGAFKRAAFRGLSRGVAGYNIEAQMSSRRAAVAKELNDQIATGDDDEIRGLTATKAADGNWYSLAGKQLDEAKVLRGRQRWGNDSFAQQTALSYEMRKASTEEELQSVANNYPALAKTWGMNDGQATGAWIGAAFENQNQHLEYKNMRIAKDASGATAMRMSSTSGGGNFDAFVNEVYEKKGSYPMAQMSSNTIEELKNAYTDADTVVTGGRVYDTKTSAMRAATAAEISAAQDRRQKIAGIAETFMHEAGMPGVGAVTDDGTPLAGGASSRRQANTPGAAHVAERVRELATLTGAYGAAPTGYYSEPDHTPTPNRREQS